jgi:oligopeptide transport system substrate-binding protein
MRLSGGLCAIALLMVAGCQSQISTPSPEILRMSIARDPISLDPTQIHQPNAELGLIRNLFDGLYRFDNNLKEVPDLATAMPDVSPDLKTWTFRLKPEARFGNGDPVTAADVIYSWSRDAEPHSADAIVFQSVVGYDAVQSGHETVLSGLSAPDNKTVVAKLSVPAGYWLVELGLWPAYVLNERVLRDHGEQDWWTHAQYLNASATGPFQLSRWQPSSSLDFNPTPNWWGGGTGTLAGVHAEIVAGAADALTRYESNHLDVIGYSPNDYPFTPEVPIDALKKYVADRALASQVKSRPWLAQIWLRFNTLSGPLAGSAGQPGRKALSQAIDRKALASAACDGGITCLPATGGMFVRGLQGYLGDNQDPNARFDPAGASASLHSWDPDGTKLRGTSLTATPEFGSVANELSRQWKANLALDIPVDIVDSIPTPRPAIVAQAFVVDFDSPSNSYDSAFVDTSYYSNATFDTLVASADAKLPEQALPEYLQAEKMLESEVAVSALAYGTGVFLVKPRVIGAGGNALYEFYWRGISIRTA